MNELIVWIAKNIQDPRLADLLTDKLKTVYQAGYDVGFMDGYIRGRKQRAEEAGAFIETP